MPYLHLGHQHENPERKCHVRSDFEWNFEGYRGAQFEGAEDSGVVTHDCRPNRIACRIQNRGGTSSAEETNKR